ncbi:alpha-galactosidase [Spirochaeta lutea]|uniref:Alpha-galactosidase n=1 Tax=Spirochaeta lutea TaxID=1480694 RepID=A0A098QZP7_9SPIO|nr:alpha-galactosidase [Spirochaeta lutea]KGE73325.1 hypothetical protein DC28_04125 [Spirochaeta lutea]
MIQLHDRQAIIHAGPLTYSLGATPEGFLLQGFAGYLGSGVHSFQGDSNASASEASPDPSGQNLPFQYLGPSARKAYHPPRPNSCAGQIYAPDIEPAQALMPPDLGPDSELWEFPAPGIGDFRNPGIEIRTGEGHTTCDLRVRSMRLLDEKPAIKGLPSVRQNPLEGDRTLEILLEDRVLSLEIRLLYTSLPEYGVIARSARVHNKGSRVLHLGHLASLNLDLPIHDYYFGQLSGTWARERHPLFRPLQPGLTEVHSRRGQSGPETSPQIFLAAPGTTETTGEVFSAGLVYSGNFSGSAEVNGFGATRLQIGINPRGFDWPLAPGESFQAPEAWLGYSNRGFGPLSRNLHRLIRERLCISPWSSRERPILLNNWEATYFDFSHKDLVTLAKAGAKAGIELFVLDDGWFGERRNDSSSLGDWEVNPQKLPRGLEGLAGDIRALGLEFGLWIEPEMVSPDSQLYRRHPDWCIHIPGRNRTLGRNQLVLDLARREVQDWIIHTVEGLVSKAPITYIKWDMNRPITESSPAHSHSYMLGLYRILEHLTLGHPEVLFEGCSAGGGRFDLGMLAYYPQFWTSDDTDAIERLPIQWGTSLGYPTSAMASHISAVPNHQVGRTTPLDTRAVTAFWGVFGYELNLSRSKDEELTQLNTLSGWYKKLRTLLQFGDLYRLEGPTARPLGCSSPGALDRWSWMMTSRDRGRALVCSVQVLSQPNPTVPRFLRLEGLNAKTMYRVWAVSPRGQEDLGLVPGEVALYRGIALPYRPGDFQSAMLYLEES